MSDRSKRAKAAARALKRKRTDGQTTMLGRIEKVKIGIERLSSDLYGLNDSDSLVRLYNYQTFKAEIVRGFILYLQLAIEHLLKELLIFRLKGGVKVFTVKKIKHMVEDMRPHEIVEWCGRLNLVSKRQYHQIAALNRTRNACAHKWHLTAPRNTKDQLGRRMKVPVVGFNGKNLLKEDVFRDDFMPVYSKVYLKLFRKVLRIRKYI
ncbi:MAG: hypothetical protein KGJ88_09500 [Verrucomicrobiota bacterium]|nr:hypothetical protein [Verrucomicrobiota bacterium]